jgi:ABC-type lipoprotein release transport system permease subunit
MSGKRMREHAALFAALLGVAALVSGLSVGVVGFLARSADDGVRTGLAERAGTDLALRASIPLDADGPTQDAEVRAAIERTLRGLPAQVSRIVTSKVGVRVVEDGVPSIERRSVLYSIADLPGHATLVDGSWPTTGQQVSLQEGGAQRLHVETGQHLLLDGVDVEVTGLWRLDDPLDPRWLGDPLLTEGRSDVDIGPVVIDESLWPRLDTDPRARWTIVPDGRMLTASDLRTILTGWDHINHDWRAQLSSSLTGLEKQGRFKRTAQELGTRVDALHAIEPVVLLLLGAIALVTLAELGRLLTTTRSTEIALLWSRGASALDIGGATAREALLAAGTGALLGAGTALGVLTVVTGPEATAATGPALAIVPIAVTLAAVLIVAGSAFRSARRQTVRDPEGAGRARRLAGPGIVILAAAAAVLSVWQLRLYGSPLTPVTGGGTQVDPIAVVAPALTMIAVVLLALVLFPRVAALDELATRRAPVARILAARTVARRLQIVAAPIVVVAVAAATLVVAAGYATTWSQSFERTSELRTGSDVHASVGSPGLAPGTISDVAALPAVDAVAPIDVQTLQLGSDTGSIVAVTPEALRTLASTGSGSFDRGAAADAIALDVPGPVLDDGADRVDLTVSLQGFAERPTVSLQLADGRGVLREVTLEDVRDLGPDPAGAVPGRSLAVFGADLPPDLTSAPGPLRILAVDVGIPGPAVTGDGFGLFVMCGLTETAGGTASEVELDPYWLPESPILQFAPPTSDGNGLGFSAASDTLTARMTPTFDQSPSDRVNPPIVISQRLADEFGLGIGDTVSFFLEESTERTDGKIAMIVAAIPGAPLENALLVDLGLVLHSQLRVQEVPQSPREFWVGAADPDEAAAAIRSVVPANTLIEVTGDPAGRAVLGSAAAALWLGAAGCGVLAVITLLAVVRAQLRSRRIDVVVLRAIGLSSRDQAAVRTREQGIVLGYGLLTGLIAGGAVTVLTVPELARAAVIDPFTAVPTPLGIDPVALGAGAAALVLALVVIAGVYASRVAVQARTAIGAEEVP